MSAGRDLSVADAQAKIASYVRHLRAVPTCAVSDASLERAGRAFKWFPGYGEVRAHLDREAAPYHVRQARLLAIAATPTPDEVPPPQSAAERERIGAGLDAIRERLRAAVTPQNPATVAPRRLGRGHLENHLGIGDADVVVTQTSK